MTRDWFGSAGLCIAAQSDSARIKTTFRCLVSGIFNGFQTVWSGVRTPGDETTREKEQHCRNRQITPRKRKTCGRTNSTSREPVNSHCKSGHFTTRRRGRSEIPVSARETAMAHFVFVLRLIFHVNTDTGALRISAAGGSLLRCFTPGLWPTVPGHSQVGCQLFRRSNCARHVPSWMRFRSGGSGGSLASNRARWKFSFIPCKTICHDGYRAPKNPEVNSPK